MVDSVSYKLLPMRKWSQNDKPSGFVITWIFFALLSVLSVKSYASEHDFDTEPNSVKSALESLLKSIESVKSALESLLKSIESLETAPAIEPNAREEIQSQTKKYIEFESEIERTTITLGPEYEKEIEIFKSKAEKGEFEVKKKVSEAEQSEEGSMVREPNTVKSALVALLLKLEAYDVTIEKERELFAPITRVESTEISRFIGSVYGEIGKVGGTFDEEPVLLSTILGYNVFNTSAEDGVLLFPTLTVFLNKNKSEYDWGNYVDYGVGVAYQKTPFIIGVEGVYRDNFENDDLGGDFFRAWGEYWSIWEADTQIFLNSEPSILWGTRYISFEYDTLEENFITDFSVDLNLDLFDFKGFTIGPFTEGTINLDTRDEPWYRYGQISGG
ncbi:MAG: zinc ribbon domain-containing protein, partial [Planctomycetota bacterium]